MSIKGQPNLWHQLWQLPHILGPKWQNLWPAERSMEDEKEQIYRISRYCKCLSLYIYIYCRISNWNQPGFLSRTLILTDFIVIHTATAQSAALWVLNALHAEPERLLGLTRASGTLGSIHVDSCGFSACRSHILSPSHILPWSPWRKKPGSRLEISMPKFVGTRQLLWGHPSSHHPKNRSSRQRSPWQRAHRSGSALLMKLQPARDGPG